MRKLLALGLVLGLLSPALADNIDIYQDPTGAIVSDINTIGVDLFRSTGTGVFGSTVPTILYGILFNGVSSNSYVVLKDTTNATNFVTLTTKCVVYAGRPEGSGYDGVTAAGQRMQWAPPAPIIFRQGLKAAAVAGTPANDGYANVVLLIRYANEARQRGAPAYNIVPVYGTDW